MLRYRIAIVVGALTVFAPRLVAQQQAVSDERGIYEAVMKAVIKGGVPASFVVPAERRSLPPPSASDWSRLGSVPAELRAKVAKLPVPPSADDKDLQKPEFFPAGAHIVPGAELHALTSSGPKENNSYPALVAKYQARDIMSFTKPVATDDGFDILVHFGHGCGSVCGANGYAWLHRGSKTDPWTVKVVITAVA
jgi:hypothetical protein